MSTLAETPVPTAARARPARSRAGLSPPQVGLTLILIVLLAAYLRLDHLAANPGWDGDEGYNWNITANLAAGHVQMFGLKFAFVQHPPLFFLLGAAAFHLFGQSMLVLRTVAVVCSLVTLPLLFIAGRQVGSTATGLLAAGLFAITPQIVIQNRFAYTYNLLMLLTLLDVVVMLSVIAAIQTGRARLPARTLTCAAIVAGLALATDQEGVYLLPPLLVLAWVCGSRWSAGRLRTTITTLLTALAIPALYIIWMVILRPSAFLFDVMHTAGRVTGGSWALQLFALAFNMVALLRFDVWIPLGLASLLLIRRAAPRALLLLVLACLLLVALKVYRPNPLFRVDEPVWPFVALGLGLATEAAARRLVRTVKDVLPGRYYASLAGRAVAVLVLAPIAFATTVGILASAQSHLATPIDGSLPRSTAAAQAMATWINARVHPDDLVLAMPQVSWLLQCRTAELLQAVAITGAPTAFYAAGISADRWAYDVHLDSARYLVVDDFTRAWIAENVGERGLVSRARATWPVVYHHGEYTIYQNPARASS